jgi:hypothetical protein
MMFTFRSFVNPAEEYFLAAARAPPADPIAAAKP